ncbi:MAG: hypothetical protein KBD15_03390 [Candidatus Magasanikbacteria bacterium]|jgi:hypothetical protein|nr:hypothetical protein [Candidatus Magasanikbacteria bacterium]
MNYLLFTTSTCPKCPLFKDFVQKHLHVQGEIIDQHDTQFEPLSREFVVSHVPTLLVFEDEQRETAVLRTSEISDVYEFIQAH